MLPSRRYPEAGWSDAALTAVYKKGDTGDLNFCLQGSQLEMFWASCLVQSVVSIRLGGNAEIIGAEAKAQAGFTDREQEHYILMFLCCCS